MPCALGADMCSCCERSIGSSACLRRLGAFGWRWFTDVRWGTGFRAPWALGPQVLDDGYRRHRRRLRHTGGQATRARSSSGPHGLQMVPGPKTLTQPAGFLGQVANQTGPACVQVGFSRECPHGTRLPQHDRFSTSSTRSTQHRGPRQTTCVTLNHRQHRARGNTGACISV